MKLISTCFDKPAIAKVSHERFKALKVSLNDWVRIQDAYQINFCRLQPAVMSNEYLLCDCLITKSSSEPSAETTITPVDSYRAALRVTIDVEVQDTTVKQLRDLGFIYNQGTTLQKLDCVRNILDGLLVEAQSIVHNELKSSTLKLTVVSVYPDNGPVVITRGTRIILTDSADTGKESSVNDLVKSLGSLNLAKTGSEQSQKPTGLEKAYESLFEMVSYPLLYKDWIDSLGIECPKGILLYGPPGVGKTFLVSSIAKACHAKMFVIQGAEVYGPYLGESEEKLRAKFKEAQEWGVNQNEPVILFIDEIDALTPHRNQAQSHENRVVAQLLTLMDGIHSRGRLIVVAATNRPNSVDPALRRPGRFDREISLDAPDVSARRSLFSTQLKKMPTDDSIDLDALAAMTNGYVAADIASLCREAATHAVQRTKVHYTSEVFVCMADFKASFSIVGPSLQRGFQVQVEKTTWNDIGGLEDVKKRLKQAVEWPILHKASFLRLGLKPPRGILLYGPPGCSKTTLVKVIASSSGAAFLSINGAQLYSPYVGDSEAVVRATFQKARSSAPAIIFLDETEAIVGKRNMGSGGSSGDSVQERVLSTLLNEMDGVETAESVLVVGATNRPDMLDAALLRPGRFDQLVYVPPPDFEARCEILRIHTRHMPLADDVDLQVIAQMTDLYTGADLCNVCREAAMIALRSLQTATNVNMSHFEESLATIPPSISAEELNSYERDPHS
ncbi:P-loop containing nucleoside triphosphate hydrolase protein [Radiomyces spectabilis]|uniref:P-loop containing nucleoside triphosphate hydrolase protein n=1 Tax=Radiomyces spectabilis TaxID=64574 RepID=UPI00221F5CA6|nr:P-loop containing nucleoside triphosphate hydrolase protein [Radiomyces spectabilis]KAI8374450.1 P-loop containing nucleoside triphosphate hydrolase protein [Radiomyces spectabilis]